MVCITKMIIMIMFIGARGATGSVTAPTAANINAVLDSWQKVLEWNKDGCLVTEKFYREVVATAPGKIIFKDTALVTQKRKLWAILTTAFGNDVGNKGLLGGSAADIDALKGALAQLGNRHKNKHISALENSTVIDTIAAGHGIVATSLLTTLKFFYEFKKDTTWAAAQPHWVAIYGFVRQYMTVGTCCDSAKKWVGKTETTCMEDEAGTFDKGDAWIGAGADGWCADGAEATGAAKCVDEAATLTSVFGDTDDTAEEIIAKATASLSANLHEFIVLVFISFFLF